MNFLELQKNQQRPKSELEELQFKRLKATLNHAYRNVPFYRKKFKNAGIQPVDIRKKDDLTKIPVTTKKEINDNSPHNMLACGYDIDGLYSSRTSGSTGEPITILFDKNAWIILKYLVKIRARLSCGMKLTDKIAIIESESAEKIKEEEQKRLISKIFVRKKKFSAFDALEQQVKKIASFKPDVMYGFPSYFKLLGEYIEKSNISEIRPRLFFCSAEKLDKGTREFITNTFHSEVFDIYGCTELKEIAWECPYHTGYHINSDVVYVEFIKDTEPVDYGEEGQIVTTSLCNSAMPLIRYTVGDVGKPSEDPCSCGRPFPLMDEIEGRYVDYFILRDNILVAPYSMTCTVENIPHLLQYQIIQEKKDLVVFKAVVDSRFAEQVEKAVRKELGNVLGKGVEIEVKTVERIPREKSGKYRVVHSKVKR